MTRAGRGAPLRREGLSVQASELIHVVQQHTGAMDGAPA